MGTYTGQDKRLKYLFENGGGGGGGTSVEANPQGTPTDFLSTIKIGNNIFDVGKIGDIYSNTERQVGVWTDGKPLYQKTVHISALPSTAFASTTYPHNIANVDKICGWDGTAVTADGTATAKFNVPQFNSSGFVKESSFVANVTKTDIAIIVGANRSTWSSDFTIQYTKTTDTAGSGIFVPSGAYAMHYSKDEQVIGTWIDGSTIYQKTFDLGSDITVPNTSWYGNIVSVTNIDKIPLCWGMYSGGTYYPLMAYHTGAQVNVLACRANAGASVRYLTLQYTKTA